jgi:hypothetical protein
MPFDSKVALQKLDEVAGALAENGFVVGVVLMDYIAKSFQTDHHTSSKGQVYQDHERFDMIREWLERSLESRGYSFKYTPKDPQPPAVTNDCVALANDTLAEALWHAVEDWHNAIHDSTLTREKK